MTARAIAQGNQHIAPARDALDLFLHDALLGRVDLVVGEVNCGHRRLDARQSGTWVAVGRSGHLAWLSPPPASAWSVSAYRSFENTLSLGLISVAKT